MQSAFLRFLTETGEREITGGEDEISDALSRRADPVCRGDEPRYRFLHH